MTYHLNQLGGLVRDADGACIPKDPANTDYAAYLAWQAEGNTATPFEKQPMTWEAYQAMAKAALDQSTVTVTRITEAVSLGDTTLTTPDVVAYMQWRRQLRYIIQAKNGGTVPASSALPAQPPFPAGT